MDVNEYMLLPDGVYEFKTYMDETIVGIPYKGSDSSGRKYIIPVSKIHDLNNSKATLEEKIRDGILIPINTDVIDEYIKKR